MSSLFKDIDNLIKKGDHKKAIELAGKKIMDYNKLLVTLEDKNEKSLRDVVESLKSTELTKKIKEIKSSSSRSNSSNTKKMKVKLIKLIKTTINDNDKLLRAKISEIQSTLDTEENEKKLKLLQDWNKHVATPYNVKKLQDCDKEIKKLKFLLQNCEKKNNELNLTLDSIAQQGQNKYNKARASNLPAEYASVMSGRSFDYSLKTLHKLLKEKEDLVNRLSKIEESNKRSNKRSRSGSQKSSLSVLPDFSKGGSNKKTKKTRRRKRK